MGMNNIKTLWASAKGKDINSHIPTDFGETGRVRLNEDKFWVRNQDETGETVIPEKVGV